VALQAAGKLHDLCELVLIDCAIAVLKLLLSGCLIFYHFNIYTTKTGLQEFEELLTKAQESDLTLEQIERMFPFPLDGFQRDAVEKTISGSSVVVCAPTGAGKTVIAVAAAVPVLAAGQRVIYTTPLKALSNQKLYELQVRSARTPHLITSCIPVLLV
jgi:superfamily II DNA or RNA helicase